MEQDANQTAPETFTARSFFVLKCDIGLFHYTDNGPSFVELKVIPEGMDTGNRPVRVDFPEGMPMIFHFPAEIVPLLKKAFDDMYLLHSFDP